MYKCFQMIRIPYDDLPRIWWSRINPGRRTNRSSFLQGFNNVLCSIGRESSSNSKMWRYINKHKTYVSCKCVRRGGSFWEGRKLQVCTEEKKNNKARKKKTGLDVKYGWLSSSLMQYARLALPKLKLVKTNDKPFTLN